MANTAPRFWNRIARRLRTTPQALGPGARKIIDAARQQLAPTSNVLDVGCGPGDLTVALAQHVTSIYAIDTAADMIAVAKARAQAQVARNVDFVHADLSGLPVGEPSFTAVTAFNVLHYMVDIPGVARRINTLLVPGGLFISSTACLGERKSFLGLLTLVMMRAGLMPTTQFFTRATLEALIEREGFQISATQQISGVPDYFIVAQKCAGSGGVTYAFS